MVVHHRRGWPSRGSVEVARPLRPVVVAVAAVLLVWVTIDVLRGGAWTDIDHVVSDLLRRTGIRAADWPQPLFWVKLDVYAVTELGAWLPVFAVLVPFVGWVSWRRRAWRPVVLLVVAVALLAAAVYASKMSVGRMPPATDALHSPVGRSFPSGHMPTAIVGWGLAAWLATEYGLPTWLRRALGVLRWAAPALTCAAMLLLDYHWLSDLVAGAALGVLLLRVLHGIDAVTLRDWPREREGSQRERERGRPSGGPSGGPREREGSQRERERGRPSGGPSGGHREREGSQREREPRGEVPLDRTDRRAGLAADARAGGLPAAGDPVRGDPVRGGTSSGSASTGGGHSGGEG
jgi:membrane-associated phospholipid phosphatase